MSDDPDKIEGGASAQGFSGFFSRMSQYAAAGLRYWEPRRLIYNAALVAVVGLHALLAMPATASLLSWNLLFGLFFLAVLANVCYCAIYPIDLFVRFSGLLAPWERARWIVLAVGTAFAAVIAHFVSTALFSSSPNA